MTVSYVFVDEGRVSREYDNPNFCVEAGAKTVKKSANWIGYRVNVDDTVGVALSYAHACERAKTVLKNKEIGTTIRLQAVVKSSLKVRDSVRFKKIQDNPVANTPGVLGVDRAVGWIEANKTAADKVRYAGICVCKHPSDHADCAAVDFFATDAFMRKAKTEFLSDPNRYNTKYVILYKEICYPAPGQCQPYFGDPHYHVHLSVNGGIHNSAC